MAENLYYFLPFKRNAFDWFVLQESYAAGSGRVAGVSCDATECGTSFPFPGRLWSHYTCQVSPDNTVLTYIRHSRQYRFSLRISLTLRKSLMMMHANLGIKLLHYDLLHFLHQTVCKSSRV